MATYYAVTTSGGAWKIVGEGENDGLARVQGEREIGDIRLECGTDLYRETEHKNLVTLTVRQAERRFRGGWDGMLDEWYAHDIEEG